MDRIVHGFYYNPIRTLRTKTNLYCMLSVSYGVYAFSDTTSIYLIAFSNSSLPDLHQFLQSSRLEVEMSRIHRCQTKP